MRFHGLVTVTMYVAALPRFFFGSSGPKKKKQHTTTPTRKPQQTHTPLWVLRRFLWYFSKAAEGLSEEIIIQYVFLGSHPSLHPRKRFPNPVEASPVPSPSHRQNLDPPCIALHLWTSGALHG